MCQIYIHLDGHMHDLSYAYTTCTLVNLQVLTHALTHILNFTSFIFLNLHYLRNMELTTALEHLLIFCYVKSSCSGSSRKMNIPHVCVCALNISCIQYNDLVGNV